MKLTTRALEKRIVAVVNALEDYWPLTVRQIYYRLVAEESIDNIGSQYQRVVRRCKILRIEGDIPWIAIFDPTRAMESKYTYLDMIDFVKSELSYILSGYNRCLHQSQECYTELWVEKQALVEILKPITNEFCIGIAAVRGHPSVTFLHDYAERVEDMENCAILYMGDLDPTGWAIPRLIKKHLALDHNCGAEGSDQSVLVNRIALNPAQVEKYNLPNRVEQLKKRDKNYDRYISDVGEYAVELDAVHPRDLQNLVRETLSQGLDMEAHREELKRQEAEIKKLDKLKDEVIQFIRERI